MKSTDPSSAPPSSGQPLNEVLEGIRDCGEAATVRGVLVTPFAAICLLALYGVMPAERLAKFQSASLAEQVAESVSSMAGDGEVDRGFALAA